MISPTGFLSDHPNNKQANNVPKVAKLVDVYYMLQSDMLNPHIGRSQRHYKCGQK